MCRNKKGLARIPWTMHSTLFRQFLASQSCLECGMYEQNVHPLLYIRKKSGKSYSVPPSSFSQSKAIFFRGEIRIVFFMTH